MLPLFLKILLLGLVAAALWGAIGSSRVVQQPRYVSHLTPADFGLAWKSLKLKARDGIALDGWFIPQSQAQGILILLHGFGASKADLLDLALAFHQAAAYHLLLIDFRGHGASGGNQISFGADEWMDIETLLNWIGQEPTLKTLPIGFYGISMGGAIGLLSMERFPQVSAVLTDCAYADLGQAIARIQWLAYHIPRFPLGQLVVWACQARLRTRLKTLSPEGMVGRIAPRPVFFIHGMLDVRIPSQEGQRLYDLSRQPKQLWLVPGAEHVAAFYLYPQEYLDRTMKFFEGAFRGKA